MSSVYNLDVIHVASPCSALWEEMHGDDHTRHCSECRKNVYNISDMTRDEAESLIESKEGDLCVRFFQRTDGTILTTDCPVGRKTLFRRIVRTGIAAAAALLFTAGSYGALMTARRWSASSIQAQNMGFTATFRRFLGLVDDTEVMQVAGEVCVPEMGIVDVRNNDEICIPEMGMVDVRND